MLYKFLTVLQLLFERSRGLAFVLNLELKNIILWKIPLKPLRKKIRLKKLKKSH